MGVSVQGSPKGGRKKVDAELNLIPFIDLLSVCILFLLMTAVWVQISKMSAFSQPSGEATISHSEITHIHQAREDRDWEFLIREEGVEFKQDGRTVGQFDVEKSRETIAQYKKRWGGDGQPKISLRAADNIVYEKLISVLDALFLNELTQVTVGGLD